MLLMKLIDYKNVELDQAEQVVLRNVNLEINSGEWVYLWGKVGSGKSTFLKSLYGALPIAGGQASVLDYDLTHLKRRELPYLRRRMGIIFQDYQLIPEWSVEENLMFVLHATGWKNKELMQKHIEEVLRQVNMATKGYKMPHQLSGGEQQRIAIARALLNSPEIILADEPTGNLDTATGTEIIELLHSIRQAGIAVLISTHNPVWLTTYPGRKLVFDGGTIYSETPISEG